MKKELADYHSVARQVTFEITYVGEAFIPDLFRYQLRRELLCVEKLRVNAYCDSFLVVTPVEDADPSTFG